MRFLAAFVLLVPLVALAGEPPRGKRRTGKKPTHVIVVETGLATGGAPATLLPRVPVVAQGNGARTRVTVLWRGVEVSGTVPGAALGLCVQKDTPLYAPDGKTPLGTARAGALVRVLPGAGPLASVETAGSVTVKARLAREALGPEPIDEVLQFAWNYETAKVTTLWPAQDLKGPGTVRLPEGVKVEAFEQAGDVLHVHTVGGIELDGWSPAANFAPRETSGAPAPDPNLVKATHEVFVDATIFADPAGKKPIGVLRGGALVEVNPRAGKETAAEEKVVAAAGTIKVTTPAPVVIPGWMKLADLRPLPTPDPRDIGTKVKTKVKK